MEKLTGIILIDKPAGITSHDVIDKLRKITNIKTIGHAGTLDPFATGLLIVAVGRAATKEISKFVGLDKTYGAEIVLGATTETLDPESEIQLAKPVSFTRDQILLAMKMLTGKISQVPPMHAAIKIRGKKLYELARKGEIIEREPRPVEIFEFKIVGKPNQEDNLTIVKVQIKCSSGTYIRALARDLGVKLGTLAYVRSLRRTAIGSYLIENAQSLTVLNSENWTKYLLHVNLHE